MRKFAAFIAIIAGSAGLASAQAPSLDVHGTYTRGTRTDTNAWGGGAAIQLTWGTSSAPIRASTSVGADYTKQEDGGPGTVGASGDLTFQPGGNSAFTPYAGGSVSENWSTGDAKAWEGARIGWEVLGGFQYKLGQTLSVNAQERFGYINGQEHTLTTRAGFLISF